MKKTNNSQTTQKAGNSKKGKLKETANNAASKTKTAAKNAGTKIKAYKQQIQKSYNDGFAAGYEAALNIPDVLGARAAASVGFNHGAKAKHKSDKAKTKVTRIKANAKN
ncbi:MAG: hypothetical protein ACI4MN_04100 [Candidatus Coproplasma sp.]